jgi:hypothetical protein
MPTAPVAPGYRIRVHADSQGMHQQQVFAGLAALAEAGLATVEYVNIIDVPEAPTSTLWMEVDRGRCSKRICYDLHDSDRVVAIDRLVASDIYFKRTYTAETGLLLRPEESRKLRPFGLNVHAVGHRDKGALQRLTVEARIRKGLSTPLSRHEVTYRLVVLASIHRPLAAQAWIRRRCIAKARDLEAPPQQALSGTVLFQTRLWTRDEAAREPDLDQLNTTRAELVRQMRRAFKSCFRGGLISNPLARKAYADCITDLPTTQAGYLEEVKRAQIAIVSRGLHQSAPWKLAEYLASSRCIVSEVSNVVLPEPLRSEKNVFWFNSVEGCLASVDRLLTNPMLAREMQVENAKYYLRAVNPGSLVLHTLKEAFPVDTDAAESSSPTAKV